MCCCGLRLSCIRCFGPMNELQITIQFLYLFEIWILQPFLKAFDFKAILSFTPREWNDCQIFVRLNSHHSVMMLSKKVPSLWDEFSLRLQDVWTYKWCMFCFLCDVDKFIGSLDLRWKFQTMLVTHNWHHFINANVSVNSHEMSSI